MYRTTGRPALSECPLLWETVSGDRSRTGKTHVILSAAKDLGRSAQSHEILRRAQDDGCPVNGYGPREGLTPC
jgi:hypothetical protein